MKLYYQPATVWRRKLLRFLDAVTVLIGPRARSRWSKLQSCCSSQRHKFVPVVVELAGCSRCGLTETRRGRPSGQEVDAMRNHPPAETSVALLMQERPRQLQPRDQRKVSVCIGAHVLPRSLALIHARTHARTLTNTIAAGAAHEYSGCKLLQLLFCRPPTPILSQQICPST